MCDERGRIVQISFEELICTQKQIGEHDRASNDPPKGVETKWMMTDKI
jgi:hypothetical protein